MGTAVETTVIALVTPVVVIRSTWFVQCCA